MLRGNQSRGDHGDRRTPSVGRSRPRPWKTRRPAWITPHYPVAGRNAWPATRQGRQKNSTTRPMWRSTQPRTQAATGSFRLQSGHQPGIFEKNWAIYRGISGVNSGAASRQILQNPVRYLALNFAHNPAMKLDTSPRSSYRFKARRSNVDQRQARISSTIARELDMKRLISSAFLALCLMAPAAVQAQPAGQTSSESKSLLQILFSAFGQLHQVSPFGQNRRSSAR